jgi:hypothetical protein
VKWWTRLRGWLRDNDDLLTLLAVVLALGGGTLVTGIAGAVLNIAQPWLTFVLLGLFLVGVAVFGTIARVLAGRLPTRSARTRAPMPRALQTLLSGMTPQARLTALIEEGQRLRALIPEPAKDAKESLAQMMLNYNLDYPARVYEWEKRVWRILNERPLSQWRALYTYADRAVALVSLKEHVDARLAELRTILSKA